MNGRDSHRRSNSLPGGPFALGAGARTVTRDQPSSSKGPTLGGSPPGLCLIPPPVAPKSKRQKAKEKNPAPRIPDKELEGAKKALDLWALLENPQGNKHLPDDLFYGDHAMKYARQGEMCCAGSIRTRNSTYANRVERDDWGQRVHFEEVPTGYTPDGEFYDDPVRHQQPQYDVTAKEKKRRRNDEEILGYGGFGIQLEG